MNGEKILKTAFALACESYEDFRDKDMLTEWLNIAVAECMTARDIKENADGGIFLTDIYGEIRLPPSICAAAMPYAVAECIFRYRDDGENSRLMNEKLKAALSRAAEEKDIEAVY